MEENIQLNIEFNENASESNLEVKNRTIKNHAITNKNIGINTLTKEQKEKFVQEFLMDIQHKLEKEKTLVVDRFEGNIAVCENRDTR